MGAEEEENDSVLTFADISFQPMVEKRLKRHSLERLDSFIEAIAGKRLTYKELTA